jgi:Helix-turn-helix domain
MWSGCRFGRGNGSRSWSRRGHRSGGYVRRCLDLVMRSTGRCAGLLRPPAPEPTRSALRLSLAEREEISPGLARGESLRGVARPLGRSPSTVSREVARNGGGAAIGPAKPIVWRWVSCVDPSRPSWLAAPGCVPSSRPNASWVSPDEAQVNPPCLPYRVRRVPAGLAPGRIARCAPAPLRRRPPRRHHRGGPPRRPAGHRDHRERRLAGARVD